jgi:hypothetical protein
VNVLKRAQGPQTHTSYVPVGCVSASGLQYHPDTVQSELRRHAPVHWLVELHQLPAHWASTEHAWPSGVLPGVGKQAT